MGLVISASRGDLAAAAAAGDSSSSGDHSGVVAFHSSERWQLHFNSIKDSSRLMVIDFTASWCEPCKVMEPELKALAGVYTDVEFAKIDVDELPDVAKQFGVQVMPTYVLVKKGKNVAKVVGAKKDELIAAIESYK